MHTTWLQWLAIGIVSAVVIPVSLYIFLNIWWVFSDSVRKVWKKFIRVVDEMSAGAAWIKITDNSADNKDKNGTSP